jgi:hypothetical protein
MDQSIAFYSSVDLPGCTKESRGDSGHYLWRNDSGGLDGVVNYSVRIKSSGAGTMVVIQRVGKNNAIIE